MDVREIRELCIEASEKYYKYLSDRNLGTEEIQVTNIARIQDSALWELKLGGRIFNVDLIKIWNNRFQETYDDKDFLIESYDADTNRLVIQTKFRIQNLERTDPADLFIISDLKFLVENVKKWYMDNGLTLNLPNPLDNETIHKEIHKFSQLAPPNEDQSRAIKNSLANKLVYVWGPPGTGKTHFVLSNAVFNCFDDNKNLIGVFAPTNNALEEAMRALLSNAEKLNIPKEKFLRLGTPSRDFLRDFKEVCEVTKLQKNINEIQQNIQIIKEVLNCRRGTNAINSAESLISHFIELELHLKKRDKLLLVSSQLDTEIVNLKRKVHSFSTAIKKIFTSEDIEEEQLLKEKASQHATTDAKLKEIERLIEIIFARIKRIRTDSPKIDQELGTLTFQNIDLVKNRIGEIKRNTEQYLQIRETHIEAYRNDSDEQLQARKNDLEAELKELASVGFDERIKKCIVVGMTLDTFISRFRSAGIRFGHIFLDEAGYAPLIKALVLCQNNTSLTLLGDHKQLPPVCEMKEIHLARPENRSVILWQKSSLFCESVFKFNRTDLFNIVFANEMPDFQNTVTLKSELRITHRFGSNLAAILDRLFYGFGFQAADNGLSEQVNVFIIDAPLNEPTTERKNIAECNAIRRLLESKSFSDFMIITPYKKQVALLNSTIPNVRRNNKAITIHKSQGREWDTVIISVVDCRNIAQTPWFTDTTNKKSQGALVLNTAVSRVKKNLFLVCDKSFWSNVQNRDSQLISNMLEEGEEISVH